MTHRPWFAAVLLAAATVVAPSLMAQPKTGPAVGEMFPDFSLATQDGSRKSFSDLAGPNGLYLVIHRSADW